MKWIAKRYQGDTESLNKVKTQFTTEGWETFRDPFSGDLIVYLLIEPPNTEQENTI